MSDLGILQFCCYLFWIGYFLIVVIYARISKPWFLLRSRDWCFIIHQITEAYYLHHLVLFVLYDVVEYILTYLSYVIAVILHFREIDETVDKIRTWPTRKKLERRNLIEITKISNIYVITKKRHVLEALLEAWKLEFLRNTEASFKFDYILYCSILTSTGQCNLCNDHLPSKKLVLSQGISYRLKTLTVKLLICLSWQCPAEKSEFLKLWILL